MRSKIIFLLLALIYCGNFSATNKDSLIKIIKSSTAPDTTKFYAYYDLAWEYIYSNPDTTYLLAKKALFLVKKFPYKHNQPKVLNLFGAHFQIKGDYFQAIDYYQKSLKIGEQLNDPNLMLSAYGNIGSLYITMGQLEKAKVYELKSLAIAEKTNKQQQIASLYNNLCVIELDQEHFEKCIEYGNKSLEINKIVNNKNDICSALGNIGNAYQGLKNLDKALECYNLCYKTALEIKNVYEEVRALGDMAEINQKKKNYKEAIKYFEMEKTIATNNNILNGLHRACKGMYLCYKAFGDKEKALAYYELYVKFLLKSQKEENKDAVNKKEAEFEYNKQVVADSIKNVEKNRYKDEILNANKAQIEKDHILKIVLTVSLVFFILFGVLIFNRFRITSRQKIIIEAKNKQTEEQKLIIEEKQKEILDSINYAKRIQDSLLENFDSVTKFFSEAFLLLKPKDIVSGDFYWLSKKIVNKKISATESSVDELFFVAVCDSTGHGVPGGFMSFLNTAYLSEAVNEKHIYEPNKIFDYVRTRLINTMSKNSQRDGFDGILMCFTKTSSFLDKQLINSELKLSYAAAHNSPVIIKNGTLVLLESNKMPVGYGERNENFTLFTHPIQKNDIIYVTTDGYADQFGGPKGKKFQYKQLHDVLSTINALPLSEQSEILNSKFEEWKGGQRQIDDVCIVGIKI